MSGEIFQKLKEVTTFLSPLLFMTSSWLMLLMNFNDSDKNEDKPSFY